jgi:hypothetical protein
MHTLHWWFYFPPTFCSLGARAGTKFCASIIAWVSMVLGPADCRQTADWTCWQTENNFLRYCFYTTSLSCTVLKLFRPAHLTFEKNGETIQKFKKIIFT